MQAQSYGTLLRQFAIAADHSKAPSVRLAAAADAVWLIDSDTDATESVATLGRALMSRVVDDATSHHGLQADFAYGDYWRYFDVSILHEAGRLTHGQAFAAAQLLFDAARHDDALVFFDRCLEGQPTPAEVLLACYNLEVLGRNTRSLDLVERAIELLEKRYAHLLADADFESERHHLSGHLYLLRGRFMPTESLGYEQIGVARLASAARSDSAYIGCYASSMAECGDFLGTITTCLDILRFEVYQGLSSEDAEIVALEVVFYLAYSLMAIGELERARQCFDCFAEATSRRNFLEARDHARLFLVKLDLKRRSLLRTEPRHLSAAFAELRSLSFNAALSHPMELETRRFERVVEFLQEIVAASTRAQEGLGPKAITTIDELSRARPGLLQGLEVVIVAYGDTQDGANALSSVLAEGLAASGVDSPQVIRPDDPEVLGTVASRQAIVILCTPTADGDVRFGFADNRSSSLSLEEVTEACLMCAALVGVRRYLDEDQYVFGMVPCQESPATKFQHPEYSIESVFPG